MNTIVVRGGWIALDSLLEVLDNEGLWLLEASIDDLERETLRGFPRTTKRLHSVDMVDVKTTSFTPYVGLKTLLVSATVLGEEYKGNRKMYNPLILFKGVQYVPDKESNTVTIRVGGKDYYFKQLSLTHNAVAVRCNCPDFRFRFSWYNAQKKSLYGKPQRYVRKTTTYPPANPLKVEGICKHLGKLAIVLYNSGVVNR